MATSNPAPARRGSLVAPLMLLGLGVLFLITNLRPEISVWRLFAQYWPFLLIFWGAARLVEYTIARAASRPIARTLTGGEILLAVAICLVGHVMFVAQRGDWGVWRFGDRGVEILGESYDFPLPPSNIELPARSEVAIENLQGTIRVSGTDSRTMRIAGRKYIRAFDRAGAEQADKASGISVRKDGGRVQVQAGQGSLSGSRHISCELEITVPRDSILRLEGRNGDIEIRDMTASVDVTGANSPVRLSNIGGNVRVEVRRSETVQAEQLGSNIEVTGRGRDLDLTKIAGTVTINGDFSGNIRLAELARPARYTSSVTDLSFQKLPGKLEMDLGVLYAVNIIGPLKIQTRSKDVRLENFSKDVDISSRRGDIDLRDPTLPLASIHAETQNGDVSVALPSNAVFSLQAETAHGQIVNQFGAAVRVEEHGRSAQAHGGVARGEGAEIRLRTGRGSITLAKTGDVQAL
ncbi:MAG TPA: DUF4097 family beta strand repeat-containing protein [Bryobacterales bacterium]|jgi:DUF4097 and DUF4098 domain-containing protein YvlB|nr:DUF4097 family beta strand repeat-containing protein [Bryobacterales bacterium]